MCILEKHCVKIRPAAALTLRFFKELAPAGLVSTQCKNKIIFYENKNHTICRMIFVFDASNMFFVE